MHKKSLLQLYIIWIICVCMQRWHKTSLQISSANTGTALYKKNTLYKNTLHKNTNYFSMAVPSLEIPSSRILVKLRVLKGDNIYGVLEHADGRRKDRLNWNGKNICQLLYSICKQSQNYSDKIAFVHRKINYFLEVMSLRFSKSFFSGEFNFKMVSTS